jgi:phage terminase large subunit GpA-like protein
MKNEILKSIESDWAPSKIKDVASWADQRRILTRITSAEPGPWRTDRVPYLRFPMECFTNDNVNLIVLKWSTQTAKTEIQLNMIGFIIDVLGGSILHVFPTDKVLERFSRTRLRPMIEACSTLREKKHHNKDLFQTTEMHYQDAIHYLSTANSAADLKSVPIEYLFCDEVGTFPQFAGRDADPVKLAMERQKTFQHTRKTVLVSSPTDEEGAISKYFNGCDLHYKFHVPCPFCGFYQDLVFSQIKWPDLGDTAEKSTQLKVKRAARYQCIECGKEIDDPLKPEMLRSGEWRAHEIDFDGDPESIAFHLNSLYSPFLTWGDIAYEFLNSKEDIGSLMNFKNGWLAEEWKETVAAKEPIEILNHRIDLEPLVVPGKALALTAGIDVGAHDFHYVIRAWARDYTSWLIRYGHIETWEELAKIIFFDSYPVLGTEKSMMVFRAFIDTGGGEGAEGTSMTEEAYQWIRDHGCGIVFGIKGQSWKSPHRLKSTNIDRMPGHRGQLIPGGIKLWLINTDIFKNALHERLAIPLDKPGAWLLNSDVGEEYASHIVSEEQGRDRRGRLYWRKVHGSNHWLDAEIYAMAAADPQCAGGVRIFKSPIWRVEPKKAQPSSGPRRPGPPLGHWLHREGKSDWYDR